MNDKPISFLMRDIARATGVPLQTVWMHRRKGWFAVDDIGSVAAYVVGQTLLRRAGRK